MGRWFLVGGCVVADWWSVIGGGGDAAWGAWVAGDISTTIKTRAGQIHTREFFLIKDN